MIRRPPISTLFPYPPLSRSPMRYSPPVMLTAADPPSPVMVTEADSIHVLRGMRKRGANAKLSGVVSTLPVVTGLGRSEEHTSELQSQSNLVCRLLLEKKKKE